MIFGVKKWLFSLYPANWSAFCKMGSCFIQRLSRATEVCVEVEGKMIEAISCRVQTLESVVIVYIDRGLRLVDVKGFTHALDVVFGESDARLLSRHGNDEAVEGASLGGQGMLGRHVCSATHALYVEFGIILSGRCPTRDDLPRSGASALTDVGEQEQYGGAQAVVHAVEVAKSAYVGRRL